ncbi:MAG: chemotaxis protein CheA [Methylophaga sp.]|nr:chemotaxis protein CheA [Methylophaga sp.]
MSVDISQFHEIFFEESIEGLDLMEKELLNLNKDDYDVETINTIFRAAHSIKGGAGSFGFNQISEFTHSVETLLDQMRNNEREINSQAISILLQAVDKLRQMVSAAEQNESFDETELVAVSEALAQLLSDTPGKSTPPEQATLSDGNVAETPTTGSTHGSGWHIVFKPNKNLLFTGNDPLLILKELKQLGDMQLKLKDDLPPFSDMEPEECYFHWEITLKGTNDESSIREVFEWVEDDCELIIKPLDEVEEKSFNEAVVADIATPETTTNQSLAHPGATTDHEVLELDSATARPVVSENKQRTPETPNTDSKAGPKDGGMSSIRVGTDKVDNLINLVGELVITQSMLGQLGSELDGEIHQAIVDRLEQLERNTRELQEGIMRIRMMPISFAFNRFPRLVHDLSQKTGKKVELQLSGEQTELDKTVMEKIGDPLVHLVRNSLDHGLETPEVRLAAGKSETGHLHLNAFHRGGSIIIKITDDGAGLNEEKILKKAIEKNLVSGNETMLPEQIHELIFLPGFSTAEQVSDISGRGVGMDVVRKNVKSLGGEIEVKSQKGSGSTFTIKLPLTLAIMDGQIIKVADQNFVIPLLSIIESIEFKDESIRSVVGKGELLSLRDEYVPLIRLTDIFSLDQTPKNPDDTSERNLIVVVGSDDYKVGLLVNELLAQQQVVIKSLETNYQKIEGFSGATILGDGTVALILDIPGMMTLFEKRMQANPPQPKIAIEA